MSPVSGQWTFVTNHAVILASIARQPDLRLRAIGDCAGITERAAHRIVGELVEAGYLTRRRVGRGNLYEVHPELGLRSPFEPDATAGGLLGLLLGSEYPIATQADASTGTL